MISMVYLTVYSSYLVIPLTHKHFMLKILQVSFANSIAVSKPVPPLRTSSINSDESTSTGSGDPTADTTAAKGQTDMTVVMSTFKPDHIIGSSPALPIRSSSHTGNQAIPCPILAPMVSLLGNRALDYQKTLLEIWF